MKRIIAILFVIAGLDCFSQVKPSLSIGTGAVIYGNLFGWGGNNEIIWSLNKSFSYGLNLGYSLASDKKLIVSQTGAYNHNSILFGNVNVYFNPELFRKVKLLINAGGGVRHLSSTQILVDSNYELFTSSDYLTGFGLRGGIGIDYYFIDNYLLGIQYFHDFYKDGFDYIGLKIGISLNEN